METQCVYCEVGNGSLYIIQIIFLPRSVMVAVTLSRPAVCCKLRQMPQVRKQAYSNGKRFCCARIVWTTIPSHSLFLPASLVVYSLLSYTSVYFLSDSLLPVLPCFTSSLQKPISFITELCVFCPLMLLTSFVNFFALFSFSLIHFFFPFLPFLFLSHVILSLRWNNLKCYL